MPSAQAQVSTSRADRYLAQLCDHLGRMQHKRRAHGLRAHLHGGGNDSPPAVRGVEREDGRARIRFDWGQCVLTASDDVLTITVDAEDASALAVGRELIAGRIATIGRRDQLTVVWA